MSERGRTRILIVDDEAPVRDVIERSLRKAGHEDIVQADSVEAARDRLSEEGPFALVLLDILMPGAPGTALLHDLGRRVPDTITIVATGVAEIQTAIHALKSGAYDYLVKPLIPEGVRLAVARALRRRRLELESRQRHQEVELLAHNMAQHLQATRQALLRALCHTVEFRDAETGAHLWRVPEYARIIAADMAQNSPYADRISQEFISRLVESAPVHDIGKVAVPDYVLLKPGKLTPEEFELVKLHTVRGRDICQSVKDQLGPEQSAFIDMAIEVTLRHHERWDGQGYPNGTAGNDTPLSGQIVHLADFYDACRSPRVYRPAPVPREEVVRMIAEGRGALFSPDIVDSFLRMVEQFAAVEEQIAAHERS